MKGPAMAGAREGARVGRVLRGGKGMGDGMVVGLDDWTRAWDGQESGAWGCRSLTGDISLGWAGVWEGTEAWEEQGHLRGRSR